jgi:hypothetical protein
LGEMRPDSYKDYPKKHQAVANVANRSNRN